MCLQITAESDVDTVFVSVRNAFDKLALKDANVVFVLGVLCSYAMLCYAVCFSYVYRPAVLYTVVRVSINIFAAPLIRRKKISFPAPPLPGVHPET